MRKNRNYKKWEELTKEQQSQVSNYMTSQKCNYYSEKGMKYNLDENGNFTKEYIDPYLLSNIF